MISTLFASPYVLLLASICNATCTGGEPKGSFRYPPATQRPRFRYWLPDGNVDVDSVRRDIVAAAGLGAGGVEFLPFFEYGGELFPAPPSSNWSTGAFGNKAWNELFEAALLSHHETGMVMDFALGPNQGQGIPSVPDAKGLQWDLIPHMIDVPPSYAFDAQIPGWGSGRLVSLVSAVVLSNITINEVSEGNVIFPSQNTSYESLVLQHSSLTEISDKLSSDNGTLRLYFGKLPQGTHHKLFAFYERHTEHKNVQFNTNKTSSIFDNGSYVVDHFSGDGAQATIDFWEEHVLSEKVRGLLAAAGNAGWEDSVEISSTINWSPSLLQKFSKKFGYDLRPYMPLIISRNANLNSGSSGKGIAECALDTDDLGQSHINDFRDILTDGYNEYIDVLRSWLNSLGLKLRNQPTYNLPMDMRASIPHVDIPECESLGFEDSVDSYKQFTGAAILSGRNVISNEVGAARDSAFSYTIPDLLWSMSRAFAGGVNQFVIHGQVFTGNFSETTWPGHVPFNFLHADAWSPKRPDWSHGLEQAMRYIGRVQYIQQQGVARSDIAIYDKQTFVLPTEHPFNTSDLIDLIDKGWCYHYLSPENLDSEHISVADRVLAASGPKFQAVVVPSNENFTLQALESLKSFAQGGLPIIVLGGAQGYYPSAKGGSQEDVVKSFNDLKKTANVHVVDEGQLASKLQSLGLRPRVGVQANGTWRTTWREDERQGISYAYIFNDGSASSGFINVQSIDQPYVFDAWTGERKPLLIYDVHNGTTSIPLDLAQHQSIILAFSKKPLPGIRSPARHVISAPPNVIGYRSNGTHDMLHAAASQHSGEAVLSDGSNRFVQGKAPAAFPLSTWSLEAELWEAPANFEDASSIGTRRNVSYTLTNLTSWTNIPDLVNGSGVGYYSSSFSWPPPHAAATNISIGAYIRAPPALNTVTFLINNHTLPPVDVYDPVIDITDYLVDGRNTVTAIVPTTMWNYVRTLLGKIRNADQPPVFDTLHVPVPPVTENGLVGPVEIIPFESIFF